MICSFYVLWTVLHLYVCELCFGCVCPCGILWYRTCIMHVFCTDVSTIRQTRKCERGVFLYGYFGIETWELLLSATVDMVPVFLPPVQSRYTSVTPMNIDVFHLLQAFYCCKTCSLCSCDQNHCIKLLHNFLLHIYCMIIIMLVHIRVGILQNAMKCVCIQERNSHVSGMLNDNKLTHAYCRHANDGWKMKC